MTDYTITTNFGAKDSLPSGNAGKVIKGSEFTTEFTNIQTAVNTKADTAGDTFTGVVNFSADVAVNTNTLFVDVSEDKVGIGTTSPDRQLTIANPTDSADMSFISGNAGTALIYFADTDDDNIGAIGYNHQFNFMNFRTNDLERMRIDSSGNVGIGETNPADKFQVTGGAVRIKSDFPRIYLEDTNNNSDYSIINDNGKFSIFDDTNSLYRFALDASGNVGIGTHNPEKPLHINSGTGNVVLRVESTDTEAEIEFMDDATTDSPNSPRIGGKGNNLFMQTNGTERMRIDASGNVLVGTTVSNPAGDNSVGVGISSGSYGGFIGVTRDGNTPVEINRKTSDGSLITLRKDGTQIGSIGTVLVSGSRYFYIGNNYSNSGIGFYDQGIYPSNGLGGFSSGVKNLGSSTVRWLTAYLTNSPNVSSDQRLKENIADADDAGSTIDAIQVRKFDWIADGRHQKYGMIAQELAEVYPEAVNVPENEEDTLGIATGDLIPMLIKEVQSLRSRVAELENV